LSLAIAPFSSTQAEKKPQPLSEKFINFSDISRHQAMPSKLKIYQSPLKIKALKKIASLTIFVLELTV
jgi:hypothetical protein